MINWIEKWLIDRRQRVVVDGEVSNWKSVLSGVPLGSVLGRILFLIYINYLDDDNKQGVEVCGIYIAELESRPSCFVPASFITC